MTLATGQRQRIDPPRPARWRPQGRAGFTLIELILVMLVLGVAAAMAAPSLTRFAVGRQASDAAAHLVAIMQFAQDQAVGTGSPYRLRFDTAKGTYWITARRDGAFASLGTDSGRTFTLPDKVSLTVDASSDVVSRGYLEFDPDGGHDVAVIRLTARDGSVILLGCASPSEPYQVSEPGPAQAQEVQ